MLNYPRTREEAEKYRYGQWAGDPKGLGFYSYECAMEVWPPGEWISRQCTRLPGHGPDGLYCKQHAAKVVGG